MALTDTAPELDTTLGSRIALARRQAGMKQEDLADLIGVARPTLSKWERDETEPRVSDAIAIAEATGVSFGSLCGVRIGRFQTPLRGLPSLAPTAPTLPVRPQLALVRD